MHHGILGQRWGKKNGPPYPLGVGDHSASEKKAGWQKSLDKQTSSDKSNSSNSSGNTKKAAIDRIKKAKLYTEEDCRKANTPEGKRRNREAADLGLKALQEIRRTSVVDDINNITNSDREWFVYEDQTIGLFTIADLANRGKSEQEIADLINDARKVDYDTIYSGKVHGLFQLSEAGDPVYLRPYIKAVVDIKNGEKKKNSEIIKKSNFDSTIRETLRKNDLDYEDYKVSKDINQTNRNMSDEQFLKQYVKKMNTVPDYDKPLLKKYNISESEFIKARKAGETGIGLEKKLYAYEDYLEEGLSPSEMKDYERLKKLEKRGFLDL